MRRTTGEARRLRSMIGDARITEMAGDLAVVAGVVAVSLGGSRARGTHRPDSDYDLGVYYRREELDLDTLQLVAERWSEAPVRIASPGEWGPWVNGGGWLTVDGSPVDWILRDLTRVTVQCDRARRGEFAFHTQAGHPLGFLDVAYAGEVATSVVLADSNGDLAALRASVTPYPPALRDAMLANVWQVDFLLDAAQKGARGGDAIYVSLCLSTAAMLLAHAWHAETGTWVINEKGLIPAVDRLTSDSHGFVEAATAALASQGRTPEQLTAAVAALRAAPRPAA